MKLALTHSIKPSVRTDFTDEAQRLHDIDREVEALKAERDLLADQLRTVVLSEVEAEVTAGRPPLTCATFGPVKVVVRESFSGVASSNREALREAFGEHYHALVARKAAIKVRAGVTVEQLTVAAGPTWAAVEKLLTVKVSLVPAKGYLEEAARLVAGGKVGAVDALELYNACVYAPQVRTR